jgi:hypothetical protein
MRYRAWSMEKYSWQQTGGSGQPIGWRQRSEDRWLKLLNIELQNNEPQNDEVITSIFETPCSIFYGSKKRQPR